MSTSPKRGFRPVRQLVAGFDTMVERLEVDEQQRRSLLADVSHELRTPLTVISGNLEAMIDGVHPTDEAHLGAILDETRVMERLIDDLRTVALSEAGTLTLHREPTDPDVLIAEVVRSFEARGGYGRGDRHGRGRGRPADPRRRSGAAPGGARQPGRERDPAHAGRWHGRDPRRGRRAIGSCCGSRIPARASIRSVLPHVFDRFVKGAGSGGSGLGLAIARHLVAAHGGTLEVEATGSTGTTFRASLPLNSD